MDARSPISGSGLGTRGAGVVIAFLVISVVMGLLAAALDARWLGAVVLGAIAVCLVFYDYRVGVVCLTLILPWTSSPLLPQTRGFNLVNFLIFASIVSLAIRRGFGKETWLPLPKVVQWCYLLPIAIAAFVAWPHLHQGSANFPEGQGGLADMYTPYQFITAKVIKPLFFVFYALLAANAVRDSKKPELFIIPFVISVSAPSLAIIALFAKGANVMSRNSFLENLGLHVNEYGMLLSLAVGPLLFLSAGAGRRAARLACLAAFGVVSTGLLLTASRGAAVAYAVVLGVWLVRRRKFSDLLFAALLMAALILFTPASVVERLTMGFQDASATTMYSIDDPLTKGRLASWAVLAPDILISPIWGQGIGSTAWNLAVTGGRYHATHPHNLYLEMLLDLGVFGFMVIAYLYYRYMRTMLKLADAASLPPMIRDYLQGAVASFLGMLAFGLTNGHYMPHPEQTFLWFGLGFVFAYWTSGQASTVAVRRHAFRTARDF